jgi:demethylmenaquinone methyltransferase / 2-methoxy-6-polyprenyl-1,4-benzoquinol methylase
MRAPIERQDTRLMREMFDEIAPRYDFVSRAFSCGMDRRWKRLGVMKAALPDNAVVLDLACGTGDFSQIVNERLPRARTIAVDITEGMLRLARKRGVREAACGNAAALPFADGTFDCVFIGYGLRNFPDLSGSIREIERVTRPGGLMVSLDFFLPANRVLRRIYLGWLYLQGGFWGLLLHGRAGVYTYIPDSIRSFVSIPEFAALLQKLGYANLDERAFVFGGIGLLWSVKR